MDVDAFTRKGKGKGGKERRGKGDKKREGACHICGKQGHWAADCWYKEDSKGTGKSKGKDKGKGKSKGKGKDKGKSKGKSKDHGGKGIGGFDDGWQEGVAWSEGASWQEGVAWSEGAAWHEGAAWQGAAVPEPEPADVKSLEFGSVYLGSLMSGKLKEAAATTVAVALQSRATGSLALCRSASTSTYKSHYAMKRKRRLYIAESIDRPICTC